MIASALTSLIGTTLQSSQIHLPGWKIKTVISMGEATCAKPFLCPFSLISDLNDICLGFVWVFVSYILFALDGGIFYPEVVGSSKKDA